MICPKCGDDFWTGESVCGRCGEPPVRSSELVVPRPAMASLDVQRQIVDIWLDHQGNDAKQILLAYRLGYNEGVKARHNKD